MALDKTQVGADFGLHHLGNPRVSESSGELKTMSDHHQPPPSVENQLLRGRVGVLQYDLSLSTRCAGVSCVVQAKVSPHLYFAWCHPAWAVKQSEMAATCAWRFPGEAKL